MKSIGFSNLVILYILCLLMLIHKQTTAVSNTQNKPIIAGIRATPGEFPWHVLLKKNPQHLLLCGGSVISNTWVLTASHCLKNRTSIFLVFGTVQVNDTAISMTSTKLFIHPLFLPISYENDIGLIELPKPLTFNVYIQPIKLVTPAEARANNNFLGAVAYISGYGYYDDKYRRVSPWLLWGAEEVISKNICAEKYGPMAETQMCTFGFTEKRQNPCKGDSGGALVWRMGNEPHKQIAIFSFGRLLSCLTYPSGYSSVYPFLDYIRNITGLRFQ